MTIRKDIFRAEAMARYHEGQQERGPMEAPRPRCVPFLWLLVALLIAIEGLLTWGTRMAEVTRWSK